MLTISSHPSRFITIGMLVLLCSRASAQLVADPSAFELRPYVTVLDSASPDRSVGAMFNLGDLDDDGADDILTSVYLTDDTGRTTSKLLIQRLGSSALKSLDTIDGYNPTNVADWDGDGRKDIFEIESPGGYWRYWLRRGLASRPYFAPAKQLFSPIDMRPILVTDVNGDGIPDMISYGTQKLYIYLGPLTTADTLVPSDSLNIGTDAGYNYLVNAFVGQFKPGGKRQLLVVSSNAVPERDWGWALNVNLYPPIQSGSSLWNVTPERVYTDSVQRSVYVYTVPVTYGDFTSDGLDDLIIGDSAHVYIFNGGSSFGSRVLQNADANSVFTSPRVLAPTAYRPMYYPERIMYLGDLSGSQIPYIAVSASTNQDSLGNVTTYFYAGGSALDPYYDATLTWPNSYNSTLTPVTIEHHPSLAFTTQQDSGGELDLLKDQLSNLPHTLRSSVARTPHAQNTLNVRMDENGLLTAVLPAGTTRLRIYTTLGSTIEDVQTHEPSIRLHTAAWPHGAYTIVADGESEYVTRIIQ